MMVMVEELERAQLGVKLEDRWCGALMCVDYIVLMADSGWSCRLCKDGGGETKRGRKNRLVRRV